MMVDHSDWRVGVASAPVHHGEILQGVFTGEGGLTRGLVTLPCTIHTTRATFIPAPGPEVTVSPEWKGKARRAAELAVRAVTPPDAGPWGGHLELTGDVPLCRGFGSSTSDVLAAIWAVKDAFVSPLPPQEVARLAVRAETASDSLMFEESTVLFAQREGAVIEDFGYRMPPVRVLGFGSRPEGGGRGVDTLAFAPASYGQEEIDLFARLRDMLREAIQMKDVALLGSVATASTEINQRHLPIPGLDRIRDIARTSGALGVQAAHSGDIAGLLFDRDDPDVEARAALAQRLLQEIGIDEQWNYTTGD
ncbi:MULTISPECIES: kinase [Streptomyces]|uniref:GHMP family kinase ATP-binding protein n=1 Tax=Streptomyces TaxID=1883 RepID=UPI002E817CAF|nr:kinase [Streptomyces sp. NBC_00589]WTI37365.1 kinase [Streptomyces sp. NBC_00775]WUB28958.1 kinase [Streptomyces sp. NBC_00589]